MFKKYDQYWLFNGIHCYFVDCCTKIRILSDGLLNEVDFTTATGSYQYFVQNNGRRAYKQENTTDNNTVLYLHWSPFNTWTVYYFLEIWTYSIKHI